MGPAATADAASAYDALAPAYDLLTADYGHDRWISAVRALARAHGATGSRVLDVACGTGSSALPWVAGGCDVTAIDASAAMVERARAKLGPDARVEQADMRALPLLGRFDVVTCLDDAINHLLRPEDVVAALAGMGCNLAPGGVLVFDANTAAAYRGMADHVVEDDERLVIWRADGPGLAAPGGEIEVRMEVLTARPGALWSRSTVRWRHRHYPLALLRGLVPAAGLRVRALHGQTPGAVLHDRADEARHPKALFVCDRPGREGVRA